MAIRKVDTGRTVIIGMGLMGSAVGARLQAAGHALMVFDVDRERERVREFSGTESAAVECGAPPDSGNSGGRWTGTFG